MTVDIDTIRLARGAHTVDKRYLGDGLYVYRLIVATEGHTS